MDDLIDLVNSGEIDIVYVAMPMHAEARVKELIDRLADTHFDS